MMQDFSEFLIIFFILLASAYSFRLVSLANNRKTKKVLAIFLILVLFIELTSLRGAFYGTNGIAGAMGSGLLSIILAIMLFLLGLSSSIILSLRKKKSE